MTSSGCKGENYEESVLGSEFDKTLWTDMLENASKQRENLLNMANLRELLTTRNLKNEYIKKGIIAVIFLLLIGSGLLILTK